MVLIEPLGIRTSTFQKSEGQVFASETKDTRNALQPKNQKDNGRHIGVLLLRMPGFFK